MLHPAAVSRGVSLRAVCVGLALLALLAPTAFYAQVLRGAPAFTNTSPPPAAIAALFLLALLRQLPWLRGRAFSRGEVLTVYALILTAGPLLSPEVLYFVLPKVILYHYMTAANPVW
jgi:hypothetical protein